MQEFTGSRKRKDIFLSRLIFKKRFLGGPHGRGHTRVKTSESKVLLHESQNKWLISYLFLVK